MIGVNGFVLTILLAVLFTISSIIESGVVDITEILNGCCAKVLDNDITEVSVSAIEIGRLILFSNQCRVGVHVVELVVEGLVDCLNL